MSVLKRRVGGAWEVVGGAEAPPITLGYAEVTANQGSIGATEVDLTGLSVSVPVAAGRRIKITGYGLFQNTGAGNRSVFVIQQDGAQIASNDFTHPGANLNNGLAVHAVETPSAGTHVYKLRAVAPTGTSTLIAGAAYPAFILVEDITGGSGSLTGSAVTPDTVPASPNAADYEFNATATSLPAGWSWVNQGTSTYKEELGVGALDLTAGGADEMRHIVRPIPADASFTVTVKMDHLTTTSVSRPQRHLVLYDTATLRRIVFGIDIPGDGASNGEAVVDYYTSATAFGSRPGTAHGLTGSPASSGAQYLRVKKNSATSWDWWISHNGVGWIPIHTGINVGALMTPDRIGVGANMRAGRTMLSVYHFRVT